MALAGPQLALHPKDEEDVNFFDQLADDLGQGSDGLLQNFEEEGEGGGQVRLDEALSKLSINHADHAAGQILIAGDQIWMPDKFVSPSVVTMTREISEDDAGSHPPKGLSGILEEKECTYSSQDVSIADGNSDTGAHRDATLQEEDLQNHASHQDFISDAPPILDPLNHAVGNASPDLATNMSATSQSSHSDFGYPGSSQAVVKELQWSIFSEIYTPEEGSNALNDFLSELDEGIKEFPDPNFTFPAAVAGISDTAPSSSLLSAWKDGKESSVDENINSTPPHFEIDGGASQLHDDDGYGIHSQPKTHIFQLDSKGPVSSYSCYNEHPSLEPSVGQGGSGLGFSVDSKIGNLKTGMHLQGDYDVLHEQNQGTLLQPSEVPSTESSLHYSSLEEAQLGVSYTSNGSAEVHQQVYSSHQQVYSAQPWESMYPGWYFDYTSNEWKQIEGWDFATSSMMSEDHSTGSTAAPDTSSTANTTLSHMEFDQGIGVVPSHLAFNQGQNFSAAYNEAADFLRSVIPEQAGLTGSVLPTAREETMPTSLGSVFADGQMNLTAGYEQRNYDGASQPQLQVSWEEQYPGWYFDHQEQQWRQIMPEVVGHNGSSAIEPLESQGDQVMKPDHQLITNPGNDWPVESKAVYATGVNNEARSTQNISFHAWEAPSVTTNFDSPISAKLGKVKEAFQFETDRSMYGAQGYSNGATQYCKESEAPSNNFYSQESYNQSNNFHGPVTETRFSADKRPPHALVAFGFGGRLVTMKASYSSTPDTIVLHDMNQLLQATADSGRNNGISYFSSLGREGLAGPLVGSGLATKEVLKWVDDRIANCELEDPQCTESLRVLWSVLRIACTHYGKLRPTHGSSSLKMSSEDGPEIELGRLLSTSGQHSQIRGITAISSGLQARLSEPQLQSIALEMKKRLVDGKRQEALQLAQQGQLWGPALVLASHLGEKAYAETVLQMAQQQFAAGCPLRTLFLLLGGQTAELFTTMSLPSPVGAALPIKDSAGGMLWDWMGNLSIIAANPTNGDEQVITHLGDCLWKDHGEVAGSHICYLVADTNFESFSENARLCLVGADHFKWQRTFATPMAIQRTELYEYAKALGNPQFILLPFQPYKLLYSYLLVEAGKLSEARRYCQAVTKALKNAGRTSDIEFCRQAASALEERLRLHSQGGYNLNSATGKFVGKFIGTLDNTLHRIIGGPPPRQASEPSLNKNPRDWYSNDRKVSNPAEGREASMLDPSMQNENSGRFSNGKMEAASRSISEPNLSWSPRKKENNTTTSAEVDNAAPKENKTEVRRTGYLSRFGSNLLSRAVEFMKSTKKADLGETNKFYYNKELKKWVEEGAEPTMEEMPLPPPPIIGGFESNSGKSSLDTQATTGTEGPPAILGTTSSSQMPPLPPSGNQYSARGRLNGVRSRYVDTFNKGGTLPANSTDSPAVLSSRWAPPTQFFMPAPLATSTNDSAKASEDRLLEFPNPLSASSGAAKNSLVRTENAAVHLMDSFSSSTAFFSVDRPSSGNSFTYFDNNNSTSTQAAGVLIPESTQLSTVSLARDIREVPGSIPTDTSVNSSENSVLPNGEVESGKNFAGMKLDNYMQLPVLEPHNSPVGIVKDILGKNDTLDCGLPGTKNGGIFTDFQEVEL